MHRAAIKTCAEGSQPWDKRAMPVPNTKFVVIKPGALGDTLLLAPGLRALRESLPGLWITVVGSAPAIDLLAHFRVADEVIAIDRLNLFAPSETEFKLINGAQVLTFIPLSGKVGRRLIEIARPARITSRPSRAVPPGRHMAVHLHACLGACFSQIAKISTAPLQYPRDARHLQTAPYGVLAPGAGAEAKQAPMAAFGAAARKIERRGIQPVFIAGEVEIERGLIRHYPEAYKCFVNPDLIQLAGLLKRAEIVFANDSGPAHLAGLLGTVTTVFFGPTDPSIWRPWGPCVTIHKFK
jgi:ADP-heptose:LPS heptosyltransferase